MTGPRSCPKCGGRMAAGHVVDQGHGSWRVASWQDGAPERSWLLGLKVRKKELREIATHACDRCGYLEHYLSA